jgi:hypothetical protein
VNESTSIPRGEIAVYQAADGSARVEVHLDRETVWLTQEQMSQLFGRERSVVTKHIRNVFREGELASESVCAKFAHTAADGKTYQVDHYNLDVVISVGYRVKSTEGTRSVGNASFAIIWSGATPSTKAACATSITPCA